MSSGSTGGEWEETPASPVQPPGIGDAGPMPGRGPELAGGGSGDAVARAVDGAIGAGGWEPFMAPVVDPILAAAEAAGDIESFRRELPALIDRMDASTMAERLHRMTFSGEASAAGEDG